MKNRTQTPATRFEDLPDVCEPRHLRAFLPTIGRDAIYTLLREQKIRNVRVGQKFLIPKAALREFLGGSIE
jgi:excisionase family DNA binding protein